MPSKKSSQRQYTHSIVGSGGEAIPIALVPHAPIETNQVMKVFRAGMKGRPYPELKKRSRRRRQIAAKKYAVAPQKSPRSRRPQLPAQLKYQSLIAPFDIIEACQRFYELFKCYPSKIGISSLRLDYERTHSGNLGYGFNMLKFIPWSPSLFQLDEFSKDFPPIEHVYIPYKPCDGLGWENFVMYSNQFGTLSPADLEINAKTVKRMIEAKGYPVQIQSVFTVGVPSTVSIDMYRNFLHPGGYITFLIRKGEQVLSWTCDKLFFEQSTYIIHAEIDYQLLRFTSEGWEPPYGSE